MTTKAKSKWAIALSALLMLSVTVGLAATVTSADPTEATIAAVIDAWRAEFAGELNWDLERMIQEDAAMNGLPDEGMVADVEALAIALRHIAKEYPEVPLEEMAEWGMAIAFRIEPGRFLFIEQTDAPLWQIDIWPPNGQSNAFAYYIDAENGEIQYMVYGPGDG